MVIGNKRQIETTDTKLLIDRTRVEVPHATSVENACILAGVNEMLNCGGKRVTGDNNVVPHLTKTLKTFQITQRYAQFLCNCEYLWIIFPDENVQCTLLSQIQSYPKRSMLQITLALRSVNPLSQIVPHVPF